MKIGIVGSEGAKFTPLGEVRAKSAIISELMYLAPGKEEDALVSGHCHLGGIDIWAEEIATTLGYNTKIYPPAEHNWSNGYKPRNLQIARNSDILVCITVNKLPPDYKGMTFPSCYHCLKAGRSGTDHTKSGGCWTVIQGMKMGKVGRWIVIEND